MKTKAQKVCQSEVGQGGTTNAHAQKNQKVPTTLTFAGGWPHGSGGVRAETVPVGNKRKLEGGFPWWGG